MPEIEISDTDRYREWQFAGGLSEFLPKELEVNSDIINYPVIQERGFFGHFGKIAEFSGERKIKIYKYKWQDAIIGAIKCYEEKHRDVSITIVLDYF